MKRCYAVQYEGALTIFKQRLQAAIAYQQTCPGAVLVYKAHGRWGGQTKRTTRWLPVRGQEPAPAAGNSAADRKTAVSA